MMYKYSNQMWREMIQDVFTMGRTLHSRAGECKEIIGHSITLSSPRNNFITHPERKLSVPYACAELLWYLSMDNSIEMISAYAPSYAKFSDDGVTANGAYGHRWKYNLGFETANRVQGTGFRSQIDAVIKLLKEDPNTRQAVVTMWDSSDLVNSCIKLTKDTPCTLTWSFFLRDGKLDMVCNMRSNDLWLGFPYDLFCNTNIQQIVAHSIGSQVGEYTHQVGSLHIYERHYKKCEEVLDGGRLINPTLPYVNPTDIWDDIEKAVEYEKVMRNGDVSIGITDFADFTLMKDILIGCTSKWNNYTNDLICNPNLRKNI